ncbi:hypothetical protein Tco_0420867 [Tanacetum coccineum]
MGDEHLSKSCIEEIVPIPRESKYTFKGCDLPFCDDLIFSKPLVESKDDLDSSSKTIQEGNFQVHSNPLFEFNDNFKSSSINPLFDKMEEDVKIENFNVSKEPVLLQTPLSDKGECFDPGDDDMDEIEAFLAMEVPDFEEGYYDSEGDVVFLENLLSDDDTHNISSEVISDHEQNVTDHNSSITFSPRSNPLHHEFVGELLTLPNVHRSSVIESLPVSPIPVEDSDPVQEEIDILLIPDDLIPPSVENDDSEDGDNELPNLFHQDDPSIPHPPPEPPDVEKYFEPVTGILIIKVFKGVSESHDFMADILPTLPTLVSNLIFISSISSFKNEDTIFDPGIVTFLKPVACSMTVSCSKCCFP